MVRLGKRPSGFAVVHVILKSYVTVAARTAVTGNNNNVRGSDESIENACLVLGWLGRRAS